MLAVKWAVLGSLINNIGIKLCWCADDDGPGPRLQHSCAGATHVHHKEVSRNPSSCPARG